MHFLYTCLLYIKRGNSNGTMNEASTGFFDALWCTYDANLIFGASILMIKLFFKIQTKFKIKYMGHVTSSSDAYDIALRVGHATLRHTKRCSAQNVIFSNFNDFECQKHVFVIRKIYKIIKCRSMLGVCIHQVSYGSGMA